ncbi:MAG: hypothetical protein JWM59_4084 [Verrucomicrobiales bacterium]|nr:hypothetical protein [Verrucomicrobiales bacterium]
MSTRPAFPGVARLLLLLLAAAPPVSHAELLHTEDFNTNGDGIRYTTGGAGVVLLTVEGNQEPAYWNRSTEVTGLGETVGVVVPAAGRRAVLLFQSAVPAAVLTPEALQLIDNTVKWLTGNTPGKVIVSPAVSGEGDVLLSERLTAAGYSVTDDNVAAALPGAATVALTIATSDATIPPTRFTRYGAPLLDFNAANHDDVLTSGIGQANLVFDPGEITIADAAHPIAAGLPGTFRFVTEAVGLDTVGTLLPESAKVIATYQYINPDSGQEETRPLLAVIERNAPLLGGVFRGFEGAGFWAGADLNEPTISADGCCTLPEEPRQLTLNPVNVAGKTDVRLTVALAATDIDFENSDYLRILIDPDGAGPSGFTQLVNFTTPTASDKFFADDAGNNRLSVAFRDVSYPIPAGATQLVVRIEASTTFFNEIVGFDNVRIHTGDLAQPPPVPSIRLTRQAAGLTLEFTGILQRSSTLLPGSWANIQGAASPYLIPQSELIGRNFFRAQAP